MDNRTYTDDLQSLLDILPDEIQEALEYLDRNEDLLEIILDLGRQPAARLVDGEVRLLDRPVNEDDIEEVLLQLGMFDSDNRAGLERTLHRISAIRNRTGDVVGLTCRIGRAVFGTLDIIEDLIMAGKSVLLLGKPGVGKTTMLREAARILAEQKRVVIVDTSNEIGGDGDVPHPAVGMARRMQVARPDLQHEVMIEAVENHNPEVIVIDEIGRELEAMAARTIAERGVQLIGTAHGITLENLLANPTLSDLVGGIESVTLSDEEARRRGTQKTILERRAPPTFEVLIEIQDRNTLAIHPDVLVAVDMLLRGYPLNAEVRSRDAEGHVSVTHQERVPETGPNGNSRGRDRNEGKKPSRREKPNAPPPAQGGSKMASAPVSPGTKRRIMPYGIARNRLVAAAKQLGINVDIVDSLDEADALVTLKNFYRRRPRPIAQAERRGLPMYVLRANTATQLENFLIDLYNLRVSQDDMEEIALRETYDAIERVRNGESPMDLSPQDPQIRRMQHDLIREVNLISHSYGKGSQRHVRIYRE